MGEITRLYFPLHVRDSHYQAVCVESSLCQVTFGCGLGWGMPENNWLALTDWLKHHVFYNPTLHYLPSPKQDDGYSCGWVSLAIHEHHIFSARPL